MTTSTAGSRLPSLTSLRFFTALLVLWQHAANALVAVGWLRAEASIGYVGVGFFFVLSGFVLTWSAKAGDSKQRFWQRRFARVYPMHIATWGLAIPVVTAEQGHVSVLPSIAALFLVQSLIPSETWFYAANGVSWSLSCEAFFYAAFPWVYRWLAQKDRRAIRVVMISLATVMILVATFVTLTAGHAMQRNLLYINPLFRIGEFVMGMCLALLMRSGWRASLSPRAATYGALGVGLAMAVANAVLDTSPRVPMSATLQQQLLPHGVARVVGELLALPVFLALIASVASRDLSGRPVLASAILQRLGTWSFALYLTHNILVKVSLAGAKHVPALRHGWASVAVCLMVCTLAVAVSGLAYRFIEAPAEARLRPAPPRPEEIEASRL